MDDASTDGSRDILARLAGQYENVKVFYHHRNQGKGAALRTGFAQVTGDVVIIQDADLEYRPFDYPSLLEPIEQDLADVVYGSRMVGGRPHRVLFFWHYMGNRAVYHPVQHVHQPESVRHGGGLQGLQGRGAQGHPDQVRPLRGGAGTHRQDRQKAAGASTRCPSNTTAGTTPPAKRSPGGTASPPSTTSSVLNSRIKARRRQRPPETEATVRAWIRSGPRLRPARIQEYDPG